MESHRKMLLTNALYRWLPTLLANFVDKSDISIFFGSNTLKKELNPLMVKQTQTIRRQFSNELVVYF